MKHLHPTIPLDRLHRGGLSRRLAATSLSEVAACTWMPSLKWMAFRSPLHRLGEAVLLVLSHHEVDRDSGTPRTVWLRGYHARFGSDAVTHWDAQGLCFSLQLPASIFHRRQVPDMLGGSRLLSHLARDLFWTSVRETHERRVQSAAPGMSGIPGVPGVPAMPPTLVALPRGAALPPQLTPLIRIATHSCKHDWRQAWHAARQELAAPQFERQLNVQLVDARLLASLPREALGEYHLLAPVLGRSLRNPAGQMDHQGRSPAQISQHIRRCLPAPMAEGCEAKDLLRAAEQPWERLTARRLPRVQVWRAAVNEAGEPALVAMAPGVALDLRRPVEHVHRSESVAAAAVA